jgi:hypothetical protein
VVKRRFENANGSNGGGSEGLDCCFFHGQRLWNQRRRGFASRWVANFKHIMETAHVMQICPREAGAIFTNEPFGLREPSGQQLALL